MFINCPRCHALVATDPVTGDPPPQCPRCATPLEAALRAPDPPAPLSPPPSPPQAAPAIEDDTPAVETPSSQDAIDDDTPAFDGLGLQGIAMPLAPDAPDPLDPLDPLDDDEDDDEDDDVIAPSIADTQDEPRPDVPDVPVAADADVGAENDTPVATDAGTDTHADAAMDPRVDMPLDADADLNAPAAVDAPEASLDAPATVQAGDATPAIDAADAAPVEVSTQEASTDEASTEESSASDAIAPQATEAAPVTTAAANASANDAPPQAAATADAPPRKSAAPSFARPAARAPVDRRQRLALSAIVAGLALLLVLQLLVADRARLATDARWRPMLSTLCGALRCTLPPWREPAAFTVLERNVRSDPATPGMLRVTTSFRNDARWAQPWPALSLSLSDVDGREVGARVFAPREYLGGAPTQSDIESGQVASIAFDIVEPSPRIVAFTFDFE